jgi:hypothetical protein
MTCRRRLMLQRPKGWIDRTQMGYRIEWTASFNRRAQVRAERKRIRPIIVTLTHTVRARIANG